MSTIFTEEYWIIVDTDAECDLKYCCPHQSIRYKLIMQRMAGAEYYYRPEPLCVHCERGMLLHIQFDFHRDVKLVGCDCDEKSLKDASWKRGYRQ